MAQKLLILLLLLLPTLAKADSSSIVQDDGLSIISALKALPLKEGVMYDIKNQRFLNTLGLGVVGYGGLGLDLSYVGVDGLGITLNYSLGSLPVKNVPIIQYVQYLNVGYTVAYRTMALNLTTDNPKSDNQFIQGPTVFVKVKF